MPETLNRIAPERVVNAYRTTGLRPARGGWGRFVRRMYPLLAAAEPPAPCEGACCALTAVLAAECPDLESLGPGDYLFVVAEERLALDDDYAAGFVTGWDWRTAEPEGWRAAEYVAGLDDGKAALEALLRSDLPEPELIEDPAEDEDEDDLDIEDDDDLDMDEEDEDDELDEPLDDEDAG
jgi:hypothetical protein